MSLNPELTWDFTVQPGRAQSAAVTCSFGNPVTRGVLAAAIAATGKGPGPVTTSVSVSTDGAVQVAFMARTAGSYSLTVISLASGDPLAGMPLQARHHLEFRVLFHAWV